MHRVLLLSARIVSVVLFVATLALWVRTCWRRDVVSPLGRQVFISTTRHRLWFDLSSRAYWGSVYHYQSAPVDETFAEQFKWFGFQRSHAAGVDSVALLGFAFTSAVVPAKPPVRTTSLGIPLWFPLSLSAIVPLVWLNCRSRARNSGVCPQCGYDLRATPDRCPECGAVSSASRSEDSPSKSTADESVHGV